MSAAEPNAPAAPRPPDYFRELVDEVSLFLATAGQLVRHPVAFSRGWAEGHARAMNPIAFFGAALGLSLGARAILDHFFPTAGEDVIAKAAPTWKWLGEMFAPQLPLVQAAIFAAAVHWRLRARGSTQLFRATLGSVLFAEGSEALARAGWLSITLCLRAAGVKSVIGLEGLLWLFGSTIFVLSVTGVHRLDRWRRAIVPVVTASVLVGLLFAGFTAFILRDEIATAMVTARKTAAEAKKAKARSEEPPPPPGKK